MKRLQSALDNDVWICVERFRKDGVAADANSLYTAFQRSNSSLKRKPKKVLVSSIERVLEVLDINESDGNDSEAEIERKSAQRASDPDVMNKSLRSTLAAAPSSAIPVSTDDDGARKRRLANGEPAPKRQKADKISTAPPTELALEDIAGMDQVVEQMGELLSLPLLKPEGFRQHNLPLPRGVLLHGPPGCGKTMISRAFAAELEVPFIEILGPSIVSSMSGDSEKGVRERFEEAKKNAPCLLFIDEIDSIAPKRDSSQTAMEKRIVAQLLVCMDELGKDPDKPVIVLAATNRPDSLDPALRRGGRFDTEINIPVPNEIVREHILRAQTRHIPVAADVDFKVLGKMTAGFVGADLKDLVGKAGSWARSRYRQALRLQASQLLPPPEMDVDQPDNHYIASATIVAEKLLIKRLKMRDIPEPAGFEDFRIAMEAFLAVLPSITPSSKREGFATIPDVSWDDVGALQSVREQLDRAIVKPIKRPEMFKALGLRSHTGVLLWGPPGCGKTLLAKAVAAESKANFIAVKGPELLNKYVGESEASVRKVFTRARSSVPCIVFFDEIDALTPKRDDASSEASSRVVNTLLSEMDGLNQRAGIYIIAATNRPDMIDNAMLRPGRLDKPLFVDLPGPEERVEILKTLLRGKPVSDADVPHILDLARGPNCKGFSGADLESLFQNAGYAAVDREGETIVTRDFVHASTMVRGSVTDIQKYHALRQKFGN